jgi:hypothetical protein
VSSVVLIGDASRGADEFASSYAANESLNAYARTVRTGPPAPFERPPMASQAAAYHFARLFDSF